LRALAVDIPSVAMTIGTQTAVRGIAGRVAGRRASRLQALAAATGAAVFTYRFLRSGNDESAASDRDDA
jgi:hypothetical protein